MTTLRETILSHLKGTTGQAPVYLDDLRKKLAKVCDDPTVVHAELDALYSEHRINRASGEKRGVKYMAYWSAGTVQTFPLGASYGRATQPPRRVAIRDTESKPINTAQPTLPTTQPEATMSTTSTVRNIANVALAKITAQPGIEHAAMMKYLIEQPEGWTEKRAYKAIWDLINSTSKAVQFDKLGQDGQRRYCTIAAKMPASSTTSTTKPKPIGKAKTAAPTPQAPVLKRSEATQIVDEFDCQISLHGALTLTQGDQRIELDSRAAHRLMTFAAKQLEATEAVALA